MTDRTKTTRVVVFSGAGLSAESGLPTFRYSPSGLWENYDLNKVCNYRTWIRNYDLVHEFYNMRRGQLATVQPNRAHHMIAQWQATYNTVIITQNVDDLLERAGCTDVIHLHGFLPEMECENCRHVWNVGHRLWSASDACPKCNTREQVKPHVVFFGQMNAPRYAMLDRTMKALTKRDFVVVTGTSGAVVPIGSYLFDRPGHKIFNALEPPDIDAYHEVLLMPATEAFPVMAQRLQAWVNAS